MLLGQKILGAIILGLFLTIFSFNIVFKFASLMLISAAGAYAALVLVKLEKEHNQGGN